jgi:hypothetical protein
VSLTSASIILGRGLKNVRQLWDETRAGWKDPVARDFESRYWVPLETQVLAAVQAMDALGPLLAQARQECS